jgi:hypothetical protein
VGALDIFLANVALLDLGYRRLAFQRNAPSVASQVRMEGNRPLVTFD